MKKSLILISTAMLMSCSGVNNSGKIVPAIDMSNIDSTVSMSDDFYQYATGGWQKNNPIGDEFARYGAFDLLRENNKEQIKELFTSLEGKKFAKGSVEQKITDIYNQGLDSVKLNKDGATPILADLKQVESVVDRASFSKELARIHKSMNNPFFAAYVYIDDMNSSVNILNIVQSGLGMGNRDYYLEDENKEIREEYQKFIEKIYSLAGYDNSETKRIVKSVMTIENAIAKASKSNVELRDPVANYNMVAIDDFKVRYSAIDWDIYAEEVDFELPSGINVAQLAQLDMVNKLIAEGDYQMLRDYLSFNILNAAATYMSDDLYAANFEFYDKTMSGKLEQEARWKRALAIPNGVLGEAVGEMYVEKYFPAEYKAQMMGIVDNLRDALSKHIAELDWMSDETKAKAQDKLATITVKIGYPDKWKDYSSLEIDAELSYWDNIKNMNNWLTADNLKDLKEPVDKSRWHMSPQTVNAYYNPPTNEICFPAAILQPPFFNFAADDAVNYGAIGVVIGHEMTHGFDDQGRQYDKDGNLSNWWSDADADAFNAKAKVLVEQFDAVEVLDGVYANGAFTLGENIADQGGLRVAYTAIPRR
ncbi:MAG: M13 family metallopeptidase, partial [Bacteroidales bacterium]